MLIGKDNTNSKKNIDKEILYTPSLFARLCNYFIDSIIIAFLTYFFVKLVFGITHEGFTQLASSPFSDEPLTLSNDLQVLQYSSWALAILYYVFLEYKCGQTIGKMITKTLVVDIYGNRPSFSQILIRAFIRLVPFAAIVIFFTSNRTLHDIVSKTYVVCKND